MADVELQIGEVRGLVRALEQRVKKLEVIAKNFEVVPSGLEVASDEEISKEDVDNEIDKHELKNESVVEESEPVAEKLKEAENKSSEKE